MKTTSRDNKTMNPGTWNPRSYCRYGPFHPPDPTPLPPPLVAFRRLVGRSLVPPSLPLAAFGASFRGEWRVMEGRGNDKRR